MAAILSPSKVRSATVFGVALTELFVLLLMVVVFLWAATAQHDRLPSDIEKEALKKRLSDAEAEIKLVRQQLSEVNEELKLRDNVLKLLWQIYRKRPVPIEVGSPEWKKALDDWMKELQSSAEGGRGHANCLSRGPAFKIVARDAGLDVIPAWEPNQRAQMELVPTVKELTQTATMPIAQFSAYGERILQWSDNRRPKCRFDVLFVDKTTQKVPYATSLKAVERVFYKSEVRE